MWPRQIASDLQRFFGRRIAEWHSGDMSSYELLELFGVSITEDAKTMTRTIEVEFPPEDGALAKALRDGRWPYWIQMLAENTNEAYRLRAAYNLVNGGERATFDASECEFTDPIVLAERKKAEQEQMQVDDAARDRFNVEIGFIDA